MCLIVCRIIFQNILNERNLEKVLKINNNKANEETDELINQINDLTTAKHTHSTNTLVLLKNIADSLLHLISDRFEDLKLGFNLLLNFIERISKSLDGDSLCLENVVQKVSVVWRTKTGSRIPTLDGSVSISAAISSVTVVVSRGDIVEGAW